VALFHPQGVYENVPEKSPLRGREEIHHWLHRVFNHISRIDVDVLPVTQRGERILTERLDDHILGDKHMSLPIINLFLRPL